MAITVVLIDSKKQKRRILCRYRLTDSHDNWFRSPHYGSTTLSVISGWTRPCETRERISKSGQDWTLQFDTIRILSACRITITAVLLKHLIRRYWRLRLRRRVKSPTFAAQLEHNPIGILITVHAQYIGRPNRIFCAYDNTIYICHYGLN